MNISATASKSLARELADAMPRMDNDMSLRYAKHFVGTRLQKKGFESTEETVKTVLAAGERRGWFRVYRARVVPALVSRVEENSKVEEKVTVCEPVKLRIIMRMYWDDETLNERCTLSASSRPALDAAINRVNVAAGEYVLDGTKTEKQVRRDVENLLERQYPALERATTSSYAAGILNHILGLAKADGQISFAN